MARITRSTVTPHLRFADRAVEAANLHLSPFLDHAARG